MPPLIAAAFSLLFTAPALAQLPASRAGDAAPAADYEAALTAILQQVVTGEGLVRYDLLRGPLQGDFERVLKAVEEYDATSLATDVEKMAFWMNAYNVQMLQNIAETPEVENIIADGYGDAFFKTPFRTAGQGVTLDALENVILRRQDGPAELEALQVTTLDPRLHVGLNCAAIDCPRLRRTAFTAETLDAELDAAMRDFAASERHLEATPGGFVLSSLLDWFGADFDQPAAGDYLLGYMPEDRPSYDRLRALLEGRTAAEIRAQPGVSYRYRWGVNAAQ